MIKPEIIKERILYSKDYSKYFNSKRKHKIGLPGRMINGRRIPKSPWNNSITLVSKMIPISSLNQRIALLLVASPYTDISGKLNTDLIQTKKIIAFTPSFRSFNKRHLKKEIMPVFTKTITFQ